jgi:hypothetical protein
LRHGNGLDERDERTLARSTPRPPIQARGGHAVRRRARGALNNQSSTNVRPEARTSRRRTAARKSCTAAWQVRNTACAKADP